MTSAIRREVALVTSDESIVLPGGSGAGYAVERHPWRDSDGPLDANALVDLIMLSEPQVLCVGADVPEEFALELSRRLDELHPAVSVILLRQPNSDLWRDAARAGVREILPPDAAPSDVVAAIETALERSDRIRMAALFHQVHRIGEARVPGRVIHNRWKNRDKPGDEGLRLADVDEEFARQLLRPRARPVVAIQPMQAATAGELSPEEIRRQMALKESDQRALATMDRLRVKVPS